MHRPRSFLCASFLLAALAPVLLHAQAATPKASRSAADTALKLVIPLSMRDYSPGLTPPAPVARSSRRWAQDSARSARRVTVLLPLDSTTSSVLECPMPVFRLAPEAIPHMPTAQLDSAVAAPRGVTVPGCTNPLDPRP